MVSPRMGLGMAALGRPGYINLDRASILGSGERDVDTMQRHANAVMDRLFSMGNTAWLDCARSYGLSEKFVGEYLRSKNVRPEEVYVSSKWGYSKLFLVIMWVISYVERRMIANALALLLSYSFSQHMLQTGM